MKDRLERFVIENKDEFDAFEPSAKLFNGIKLKKAHNDHSLRMQMNSWKLRVAAGVVIFISLLGVFKYQQSNKENGDQRTAMQDFKVPELMKAEAFYTSQVNSKLSEIKLKAINNPEVLGGIKRDFQELDSLYAGMKQDLSDDVANKEVINAMVQNYKMKLDVLEEILLQLNRKNQKNQTKEGDNEKKSVKL